MHKKIAAAFLLPAALLLSSCDLLPAEEAVRTVTTVRTVDQTAYKTAEIIRGNMAQTRRIYCTYLPLRTDSLSFSIGGEYVDEVFVQVGDFVQKGQLLAQLVMEDLDAQIQACRRQITALETELGYLAAEEAIAIRRQEIMYYGNDKTLQEALKKVSDSYASRKQAIEDSLHLERMLLDALKVSQREKQIIAPYDGTITYLKPYSEGETTRLNDRVMTIVDSSMSIFRVDTEYWSSMPAGMQYTITANGTEYKATVTTPEELGLEPVENKEGSYGRIYLKPDEMVVGLKDNDRGTLELVLDSRTDVLIAPVSAIAEINGQEVVYCLNENGFKHSVPVQTGMQNELLIEVVSGVQEGDRVVVPY